MVAKIKVELSKLGYQVPRRRIGRIMKANSLVSRYTIAQFKPHVDKCSESKIAHLVKRNFKHQEQLNVVISDLTYVRAGIIFVYL